jgi:GAF domain-containing protein
MAKRTSKRSAPAGSSRGRAGARGSRAAKRAAKRVPTKASKRAPVRKGRRATKAKAKAIPRLKVTKSPAVKRASTKSAVRRSRPKAAATSKSIPFAPKPAVTVTSAEPTAPQPATNGPSTSTLELIVKEVEASLPGVTKEEALDNVVDVLTQVAHYNWVGIYLLDGDTLVLGPFRGAETEHVRIPIGQGICGLAARTAATVNVPDVNQDSRYLACFLSTRSELVVPIFDPDGKVVGEIDNDSDTVNAFTQVDESVVERIARLLTPFFAATPEAASERFIGTN